MAKLTRRGFLGQASAGVVTIGVLGALPVLTAAPEATDAVATDAAAVTELSAATSTEPLMAHVSDLASGEISILVGTQEIIYRDPGLVMRLLQAVR
jgi:hypothetical protein